MAWRPYENLLDGELSNRVPGKVTGWMRFFRRGKQPLRVVFDLAGDFHEDIRGSDIWLMNSTPPDRNISLERDGTYMEGFDPVQRGTVGDMTAGLPLGLWTEELAQRLKTQLEIVWQENGLMGTELEERRHTVATDYAAKIAAGELYYPYVQYPYFECYSDNGRVVLELDPSQIMVIRPETPAAEKSPQELAQDRKNRAKAFGGFMTGIVGDLERENRKRGGDGNVTGIVIGK
jgi:hypothetical protein